MEKAEVAFVFHLDDLAVWLSVMATASYPFIPNYPGDTSTASVARRWEETHEKMLLENCYRGDSSLLLGPHPSIYSSDYQDILRLQLPVQQCCGGDLA